MRDAILGEAPPPVNERPVCPGCGDHLKPDFHTIFEDGLKRRGKVWRGYKRYGYFCKLRCAAKYANEDVRWRKNDSCIPT